MIRIFKLFCLKHSKIQTITQHDIGIKTFLRIPVYFTSYSIFCWHCCVEKKQEVQHDNDKQATRILWYAGGTL